MGPSPKKRHTVATAPRKRLEAFVKVERKGAAVIQKAQERMMEGGPRPHRGSMSKYVQSDSNAATTSTWPHLPPVNPEEINYEIKCNLMTEIRQCGRQYERIFKLLEEVQGSLDVKIQFVEFAIEEANRFKRSHLIHYLEKKLENLFKRSVKHYEPSKNM